MTKSVLHQILDRSGFSAVTKDRYRHIIDRWIEFAGADPSGWTRDKAQEFYDGFIEGGISIQSANTYLASLRYVSKWYATKSGGVDFAIVQKQRGRKGKSKRGEADGAKPILSPNETTKLLGTCRGGSLIDRRDFAMFVVGLETGMRRISLRGLTFEGLTKRDGFPAATVPIKGPGGEETFTVPLSDTAYRALSMWTQTLLDRGAHSGPILRRLHPHSKGDGVRFFEIGKDAVSLTSINEIVEGRARAAELRHVNPHMLRHTFVTSRLEAGYSPLEIAEITGHRVSAIAVDGVRMQFGSMTPYIHRDITRIRNSTPEWLRDVVDNLLKEMP